MDINTAKLITVAVSLSMFGFAVSPLSFAGYYIVLRPLVQPFGTLKYTMGGGIPLTSIFSILLIIFAFFNSLRNLKRLVPGNILLLYMFCFFAIISLADSPSVVISFGHMLKILTAVAMYLLIYNNIDTIKDVRKILTCYLLSAVIPLMFGFYQYITKTAHAWENGLGGTRIDSVLGQPNAYGEYLAVLICVLIVCFFYKKLNYNKWVLIMFSLAVTVSFVLSLNRGSWIALFTGALFATVWYKRHVKPFLIIAGIAVFILITSPILIERFIELTQKTEFGSKNTLLSRVNYWDNMFNLLMERPFLGYGLGTAGTTSLVNYVPHNDYLRLAFETGIPTAFLYIMFLFKEFLDHIRRVKTKIFGIIHYSVFVLLVYFIVLSFFQNIVYNQVVFPMVLGLFAMSARLHDLERSGMIEAGT